MVSRLSRRGDAGVCVHHGVLDVPLERPAHVVVTGVRSQQDAQERPGARGAVRLDAVQADAAVHREVLGGEQVRPLDALDGRRAVHDQLERVRVLPEGVHEGLELVRGAVGIRDADQAPRDGRELRVVRAGDRQRRAETRDQSQLAHCGRSALRVRRGDDDAGGLVHDDPCRRKFADLTLDRGHARGGGDCRVAQVRHVGGAGLLLE